MNLGSKEMIPIFVGNIDLVNSNKNVENGVSASHSRLRLVCQANLSLE